MPIVYLYFITYQIAVIAQPNIDNLYYNYYEDNILNNNTYYSYLMAIIMIIIIRFYDRYDSYYFDY